MLDFFIIMAVAYFAGLVPLGFLIKAKGNINIWFENNQPIGVMNIHRLLGLEWAVLLLVAYFIKGYLGLWLANYLWGNSFINLTAASLIVCGQSNLRFSSERGGIMPIFLGILYYWDAALAGLLTSIWISAYLLTKRVTLSTVTTLFVLPFLLLVYDLGADLVIFSLLTALFVIKYHIFTSKVDFAERGNY